jgi:AmmeMemoRadiSam system protein A
MALSACIELPGKARQQLLSIARNVIESGRDYSPAAGTPPDDLPAALLSPRGAFVTLHLDGRLRGCVGNIAASRPLVQTVADAAHNAAFRDRRFSPLGRDEVAQTHIEISVLSPLEPMQVSNREDLLRQLSPGEDGLLLQDGLNQATFLPKVWEQLPEPGMFLSQLLHKAGLPEDHWSSSLRFERYHSISFGEASASVPR